jgi:hypothetical protein
VVDNPLILNLIQKEIIMKEKANQVTFPATLVLAMTVFLFIIISVGRHGRRGKR